MPEIIPLKTPLLNANEDHAMLASLEVSEGQVVSKGDLLAVFETTKSTAEFIAEKDGRVLGLMAKVGDILQTSQVWAYLADSVEINAEELLLLGLKTEGIPMTSADDEELHFTKPALNLAKQHGLSASDFDQDGIITEKMVHVVINARIGSLEKPAWVENPANDSKRLIIFGAGGHGCSLAELIRLLPGYQVAGFVDDGVPASEVVLGLPVFGGKEILPKLFAEGITLAANGVGGIGNISQRVEVFHALRAAGFFCPTFVHPYAFIEASAQLSHGVQVFPFAYVGSQVVVEYGCIINTGAIVSHDCQLGEMTNLSPGATLAGGVAVGERALVGMRATVNLGVRIGAGARIGNGATVKSDVPENGVVPAGAVWPLRG
jgi:sugar O-acyltransferase (sialic acid O-acetyltransferase NeuD family)